MKVKFVQPRYEYGSYTDYRALVKLSGFETCFVDEMSMQEEVFYIISPVNGEYRPFIDVHRNDPRKCKIAMWQLERPGGERPQEEAETFKKFIEDNKRFVDEGYADEIWISDKWMAESHADPRIIFMPMGSHTDLHQGPKAWEVSQKTHDYMHLSYISYRRQIFGNLAAMYKMRPNHADWGDARATALRNTKFLVNVHQDVHPMGEPLRIALAAASGIPYITESINGSWPLIKNIHYKHAKFDDMLQLIKQCHVAPYDDFVEMGKKMHDLMCIDHRFDKAINEYCKIID